MSEVKGRIEHKRPRWTVDDTGALARTIQGVCGISQAVAEQIVAELLESGSKTAQFETQTILTGKPTSSRTTSTWVAREVTWTGISKHTGYELTRKDRVAG